MVNFSWASDLHLDCCNKEHIEQFLLEIRRKQPEFLLISGDISNGLLLESHLDYIDNHISCSCYFVLGNHDYYHRSIKGLRSQLKGKKWKNLHYLSQEGVVVLSDKVALIGCDGWADGRAGNFFSSPILLKDFQYIKELKGLSNDQRWTKLKLLGDEEALLLEEKMQAAYMQFDQLIVLTHIPPFEEVALHKGYSDPLWLPFMVCKRSGEVIRSLANKYSYKQQLVLCGHSHTAVQKQLTPNLKVCVAGYDPIPKLQPLC